MINISGKDFLTIITLENLKIYYHEILSLTNSIMYVLSRNKSVFRIVFTKIGHVQQISEAFEQWTLTVWWGTTPILFSGSRDKL